ncbi:hypothetical protein [Corynebacterium kroppenstedtii]|uniref:hypothetical protein n=1 Tax=Corynebacterium kroppenstedtii TaxID=161879 RepID=UPI0026EC863F|nr:hypothetical protein [Corynebacterium kroppenstedtii]MDU7286342.1 hypothetical protein [Corynebacterium kroppenstedtii]
MSFVSLWQDAGLIGLRRELGVSHRGAIESGTVDCHPGWARVLPPDQECLAFTWRQLVGPSATKSGERQFVVASSSVGMVH